MINTVLQLSTPVLIAGGLSFSTLIPAIEAAIRAIFATGQFLHNRSQYFYAKVAFRPQKSFSTSPEYKIGRDCLLKHIETTENSKLPDSCTYDLNKPNSKLKLTFGNQSFEVDREVFQDYSLQYKDLSQDFDAFNNKIGSDADNQTPTCIIPSEIFTENSFHLLKSYLTNKDLFNLDHLKSQKLNFEKFIDLYKLAEFLHIPDLEARCVRIVKECIDDGRIDIDQFDNAKYNIQDESFRQMLFDIKNFKKDYYDQEFKDRIALLDQKKNSIVKEISDQIKFAAILIFASMVPIAGPALVHFMTYCNPMIATSYSLRVSYVMVLGLCWTGIVAIPIISIHNVARLALASLSAPISQSQLITLLVILLLTRR